MSRARPIPLTLTARPLDLRLARPFGIARGVKTRAANVLVTLRVGDDEAGLGEGAPNARYGETQAQALDRLAAVGLGVDSLERLAEPGTVEALIDRAAPALDDCRSALAALDAALWDAHGRLRGEPLHRLWGTTPTRPPPTSLTIGLDEPEAMVAAADEAAERFAVLKVKLGGRDRAWERRVVTAIRAAAGDGARLRVDANEGWSEPQDALDRIGDLADLGVELVEQPLPAGRLADTAWLKARSPLPLFADEDTLHEPAELAAAYHGVNVKLDKGGGLLAARRRIAAASDAGLAVMIGCMVASSLALTAAAQLAGLADHLDLDGHLLLADDPFDGLRIDADGQLTLPERPGLGVRRR